MMNSELKAFIDRLEALDDEIHELTRDVRDIMKEAKAKGYKPKAIRAAIKYRLEPDKIRALELQRNEYLAELGFESTPLGQAATVAAK